MLGNLAIVILIILVIVKVLKYYEPALGSETKELARSIRVTSENLNYSEKKANVIALLAKIEEYQDEIRILIPTKGFWELSTNADVRSILLERVKDPKFKNFLDLNFGSNVSFSEPELEQNEIVIVGNRID